MPNNALLTHERIEGGSQMPKIDKKLMPCEVNQGLLYVTELRHLFPESSRPVTVIDSDGQKFHWRMHSSQPRIDGLTKLHRKHKSRIGQTVIIEVNPSQAATAYVVFEDALLKLAISHLRIFLGQKKL